MYIKIRKKNLKWILGEYSRSKPSTSLDRSIGPVYDNFAYYDYLTFIAQNQHYTKYDI